LVPATPTADLITNKTDLAALSYHKPLVRGRKLPPVLTPVLTAVGIFLLVLLLFKAPVVISQLQYVFSNKPQAAVTAPITEVVPAANTISIPKINVSVPVIYEPSTQEATIQTALQNGVVHYGNTAVPGQNGNVAIFGHSSNDWWEPGNYKFVFVLLDKLSPGDKLTLDYQSKRYTYEVTGSKVVEPTDVGVLNPTATPTLTLITCTPPGTSLRRLVVTAKQTNPAPSTSIVVAPSPKADVNGTLPSSSSNGFWGQVASAWKSMTAVFGGNPSPSPSPSGSTPSQLPAIK
jgi:sortase A